MSRLAVALTTVFAVFILAACGGGGGGGGGGDTTAPTVVITSHSDGETVVGTSPITVNGTLADDGVISALTVLKEGVDVTSTVSPTFDQTSFSFSLNLAGGANSLEVQATDEAANSGASGVVNLLSLFLTGISAGVVHTCATASVDSVRCWGAGNFGKLGHNTTLPIGDGVGDSIIVAGDVPVGATVAQIAAGSGHTCALLDTGAVRCWGQGLSGKLGYGATDNIGDGVGLSIIDAGDVPVGGIVTQIGVGTAHTCALLDTGVVRCWGIGNRGVLGHGNTDNIGDGVGLSIIAAGDVPVGGPVTQIAVGLSHTCALLTLGEVRCWGFGSSGQLGHDATTNIGDGVGASIIDAGDVLVGSAATRIAVGSEHTCALLAGGLVRCWGRGSSGQLGHDATANIGDGVGDSIIVAGNVPVGASVAQISAGEAHTCALLGTTETVRCWGDGSKGQLGQDSTANIGDGGVGGTIIAAGDVPVGGIVTQVSTRSEHTCALLESGVMRCWGLGTNGQLGYNSIPNIGDGGVGGTIIAAGDVPVF